MSSPVVLRRIARVEFDDAAEWYELRCVGLGKLFVEAVQRVLDKIAAQPDYYPQVFRDVREALVTGYPYCVYYKNEPKQAVVLSIFHTARNPSLWQKRS